PARRALHPRQHGRAAVDARFHGGTARRRRPDRRPGGPARARPAGLRQPARPLAGGATCRRLTAPGVSCEPVQWAATPYRGSSLAKPNYSFEKRQREIAKKKKQDQKDARKREAREAAKAAKSDE